MLFTTTSQFAVLALCLLAGWIFGLASHPGGKKAKERLRVAEAEHAAYRKDAEARIKAAEIERDRLAKASPVTTSTMGMTPQSEARPADRI
ncbi:MAG: CIR N-terminal domain-containing protein [Pseudomonadota bacterium]